MFFKVVGVSVEVVRVGIPVIPEKFEYCGR